MLILVTSSNIKSIRMPYSKGTTKLSLHGSLNTWNTQPWSNLPSLVKTLRLVPYNLCSKINERINRIKNIKYRATNLGEADWLYQNVLRNVLFCFRGRSIRESTVPIYYRICYPKLSIMFPEFRRKVIGIVLLTIIHKWMLPHRKEYTSG